MRDQFVTALQTQQRARAFQLTLGKKADNFAIGDFFRGRANRRARMTRVARDAADESHKGLQDRLAIKFLVDDVADRSWARDLQNDRIDPGDVIWQKQKSALREMLNAKRSDAVNAAHQRASKEMKRAFAGRYRGHGL